MELRVLRYFVTVARIESITHAADLLHITQPTLSRQLTNLEEELGMQLLIRGKRKISLTDGGKLCFRGQKKFLPSRIKQRKNLENTKTLKGRDIHRER